MQAVGLSSITTSRAMVPQKLNDREWLLTFPPNNAVMSVQLDGAVQERPAGTSGPWERCTLNAAGTIATFAPTDDAGNVVAVYSFPVTLSIPNVNV